MKVTYIAVLLTAMVLLLSEAQVSNAASCSAIELAPCLGAIMSSSPPSGACCSKLSEQKPCLCQYMRDPNLRQYVNTPGARSVSNACRVPLPNC
uniref:Lipid transfer protein 9.5 n=1 Tax=Chelidonium majus TaxID=71251 RepID=A0A1R7SYQ7_CHEMJ|nr:lipid transfer protein 9.5 [Chelidonium majus]